MMTNHLEEEIRVVVEGMENQNQQHPHDQVHDVYVLIVREHDEIAEDQSNIVDSTPAPQLQKISFLPAYVSCSLFVFIVISCLVFQTYLIFNPAIATITIIPKSQQMSLNGTLHMGRLLPQLTLSQSATTPTTGHGHQNARTATGYLTFFNGQFQSVTIAAGTILTGSSGIEIVTNQDATIPAGDPPSYGQVTISAYAINAGSRGNIAAYDINEACCATSVLVKNTTSFYGGVDERDFSTVTQQDINKISTPLTISLAHSMHGALEGQLQINEQLQILPCSPTVTPNHHVGDEATSIQVTVSMSCSAVAYNTTELEGKVRALLTSQAQATLSGYSLFGAIHINVTQASVSSTSHPPVFLSFKATGTWLYGLSPQSQEQIKNLVAGKSKDQAVKMLEAMPGVERGTISFTGFGDETKLPKNTKYIHIALFVM